MNYNCTVFFAYFGTSLWMLCPLDFSTHLSLPIVAYKHHVLMSIPGESTNIGSPVHPSIPPTPCSPSDEWTAIPVGIEGDDLSKSTGRAVTQRAFNAIKEYLQCDLDSKFFSHLWICSVFFTPLFSESFRMKCYGMGIFRSLLRPASL